MPRNLEIKARIQDIQAAESIAKSLPATFSGCLEQVDTYFRVPQGRLKLREINQKEAELIFYKRDEKSNQRMSDFTIYPCMDSKSLMHLLEAAFGILQVVEKRRTLYMYNATRIHLDEVKELGSFIELETPINESNGDVRAITDFLVEKFVLRDADYITCSYLDLMQTKLEVHTP